MKRDGQIGEPGVKSLQVGKLDDALKRFFELRGGTPLNFAPLVSPVIRAEYLLEPPWNYYEGGIVGGFVGAVAGQVGYFGCGPITGDPTQVLVIDEVSISPEASIYFRLGWASFIAGTSLQARMTDTRTGAASGSLADVKEEHGTQVAAWAGDTIMNGYAPVNIQTRIPGPFVRGNQGTPALTVYAITPNVTFACWFKWRVFRVAQ